jgi:hypothetical protein
MRQAAEDAPRVSSSGGEAYACAVANVDQAFATYAPGLVEPARVDVLQRPFELARNFGKDPHARVPAGSRARERRPRSRRSAIRRGEVVGGSGVDKSLSFSRRSFAACSSARWSQVLRHEVERVASAWL